MWVFRKRFVEDFYFNFLEFFFVVGHTTVFQPAKKISKNLVAVVNSGSSGVVVSCGCVACLKLEPDNQVEINIASLNGVEKKIRDVFFDVLIEVGQSLVTLPALVADGLFVDVLLGAN